MKTQPVIGEPEAAIRCSDGFMTCGPIVVSIPHGGRFYPEELMAQTRLDLLRLRGFEDILTDELFAPTAKLAGQYVISQYARAWLDCNRAAWEMEQAGIAGPVPPHIVTDTVKARVGLGFVPTRLGLSRVYHRKLEIQEIDQRFQHVWTPYHDALKRQTSRALNVHEQVILLDCHSMPGQHIKRENGQERIVDIVIGDGHGQTCDPVLRTAAIRYLEDAGFVVTENQPYAGGYITTHYGKCVPRLNAMQIEVRRSLYCDEAEGRPNDRFEEVAERIGGLVPYLGSILRTPTTAMAAE